MASSLLNERDHHILDFIDEYWERYWTSPSYARISEAIGVSSSSSVHWRLRRLVRLGYLEECPQESRNRSVLYRRREVSVRSGQAR